MDIEDEAAFEASRREVDLAYDELESAPTAALSQADVLKVLNGVCVISKPYLQKLAADYSVVVDGLNSEFVRLETEVSEARLKRADFDEWQMANHTTFYQVSYSFSLPTFYLARYVNGFTSF